MGPFNLEQPGEEDPALLTIAISAAFSADGSKLYTLINTLAELEENVSSQLGIIDQTSGTITPIGAEHPFNLVAMEVDSEDNILATGFDLNPNPVFENFNWFGDSKLYNVNKETGELTEIGETNIDDGPIMDLAIDSEGTVWATTRNKLWTLDTVTGELTLRTDISGVTEGRPEGAEIMAIFFDANDTLWGTDIETGDLFTIDTITGNAEFITATGFAQPNGPHGGDFFVPEPSAVTLVAVGLFGVLGSARRRRKRLADL